MARPSTTLSGCGIIGFGYGVGVNDFNALYGQQRRIGPALGDAFLTSDNDAHSAVAADVEIRGGRVKKIDILPRGRVIQDIRRRRNDTADRTDHAFVRHDARRRRIGVNHYGRIGFRH